MSSAIARLLQTLDLEPLEPDVFRGTTPEIGWQRVYGGLVVAQALVAASRTVEDARPAHSLQGYFLRGGEPGMPIIYRVERLRDGKSFSTRRCDAFQNDRTIFSLSASFHVNEPGLSHSVPMPDVAAPEMLASDTAFFDALSTAPAADFRALRDWFETESAMELRPVPANGGDRQPASHRYLWMRARGTLPEAGPVHRAVLAYLSDLTLLDAALAIHGRTLFEPSIQGASLDHAIWFHRPFRADEWMLYAQDSPHTGGARGFARGLIFDRAGTLIASVAQEGLLRLRAGPA